MTSNASLRDSGRVAVLSISIGTVVSGSRAVVDPNLVSNNVAPGASAFTFQRKVFYDTVGRNYWVFYYDGYYIRYRYSSDGTNWYVPSDTNGYLPGYWPGYQTSDMSLPPILNAGQTVVVATGESVYATNVPQLLCLGSPLLYRRNNIWTYHIVATVTLRRGDASDVLLVEWPALHDYRGAPRREPRPRDQWFGRLLVQQLLPSCSIPCECPAVWHRFLFREHC